MEKRIALLLERTGVKRKSLRILRRKSKKEYEEEVRNSSMCFGSVWGIADKSVPFDNKRKSSHIKSSLRPCVVLETPEFFGPYELVEIAPGTTKPHNPVNNDQTIFIAEPPQDKLKHRTYFLIHYRWFSVQKNLQKKICVLSQSSQEILTKILASL